MRNYTTVKSVNTLELKPGDLVKNYGVVFRIVKENNRKDDKYGQVVNFSTECVQDDSNGFFPKSWLNDFSIQGNQNARWNLVEEAN